MCFTYEEIDNFVFGVIVGTLLWGFVSAWLENRKEKKCKTS